VVEVAGLPCGTCGQDTPHRRRSPDHFWNLVYTLFTCGLWGIVWADRAFRAQPWVCTQCGAEWASPSTSPDPAAPRPSLGIEMSVLVIGLGIAGGVVLLLMVGAGIVLWSASKEQELYTKLPPTTTVPVDPATLDPTLFLHDGGNDGRREIILKHAIGRFEQRCDKVVSASMSLRGSWVVRCSPGHSYRVQFDHEDGSLVSVKRI
jgi:hypothetical protein